jgi:hypothetical protein
MLYSSLAADRVERATAGTASIGVGQIVEDFDAGQVSGDGFAAGLGAARFVLPLRRGRIVFGLGMRFFATRSPEARHGSQ